MAALIHIVADAVVTLLNAGVAANAFALDFAAARVRVIDLKATTSLKVVVLGTAEQVSQAARDEDAVDLRIEIGIVRRIDRGTFDADVDLMVELVEQARDSVRAHDVAGAEQTDIDLAPLYDHGRLLEKGLFAAVVVATYRVHRDREEA